MTTHATFPNSPAETDTVEFLLSEVRLLVRNLRYVRMVAQNMACGRGHRRRAQAIAHILERSISNFELHIITLNLDSMLGIERNVDHNCAKALSVALGGALGHARSLTQISAGDHDLFRELVEDLFETLRDVDMTARAVITDLERFRAPGITVANPGNKPFAPASHSARLLINIEIRLLPAAYRKRYAEELLSELHDLTQAKVNLLSQLLYVFRQLRQVWQLRAALQAPGQARFHRLYRAACWILASDWRTWVLLGPLMAFAIVNVFLQQGWGSAFFTIPTVVAFYAGVEWLRSRWDVKVKARRRRRNTTE
ncbi:hypothetical protein ABZ815_20060 [Nonomuraea sp. NPDC047529]|uniref:hypothetical protein n=1 Tax=Nonomuraea sp. NPDC047529 TaxID=3155623 RepID=UPI0033C8A7E6